ncbi:TPA: DNA cytosine methyltransferase [Pseudomonas aeruginosa]|nr:DNA cytosine methyltransferase [Pseudomonas aeruginosa]HCE7547008.1 DNA cytosine methyltransferase [Pseudomonas aeruginosa]HCE7572865.1 DNA cytosine methyltransferase [Pseudomonas aeruginosa]HCE7846610.1 DNA cytosine methyltransferase [Pseudomonas aeruginosa]HCE7919503.1 DNA cytosine methyltransferase [Pseudomonas aeruginosa]
MLVKRTYKHFGFCCGLGSGAAGFNDSSLQIANMLGNWRCIGGVDIDPAGLADFEEFTGTKGTLLDLFTREQYIAYHGKEPPAGWKEATLDDIRRAAGNEDPDGVFISSPCKGASGLLPESMSVTPKYMALNELTLRCVWLMLEAWRHNPVKLIIFENVPRLASRGRYLLDQIVKLFRHYGYAVEETVHDCGKIANLAQSRPRFLLVARHLERVPAFLYQPQTHNLRGVGEILDRMPMPGDLALAGPMHRVPALHWKTWVRLALVEPGKDWRSLNRLAIEDGYLRDLIIVPEYHSGYLGVHGWGDSIGTIAGRNSPTNGAYSVADPRPVSKAEYSQYGVIPWARHSGVVTEQRSPGQGPFSVADPRPDWNRHSGNFRVVPYDRAAGTIIAGGKGVQGGWQSVADPRVLDRKNGDAYLTGGHYGVVRWDNSAGAVSASARHDNGRWSVADTRLPAANDRLACVIRSPSNTWNRPFTTLELAALQSMFDPEDIWQPHEETGVLELVGKQFILSGSNDGAWRERIGNAVPRKAGKAIADVMLSTLMLSEMGETFTLNSMPVWCRPLAMAISLSRLEVAHG